MTRGGGLSDKQRAALDIGRSEWADERRRQKAAGMKAAREWNAAQRPVPATEHMPFDGHRNCAGEAWCVQCKELRTVACSYALCPLQANGEAR